MAEQVELEIRPREVLGKATKRLRREGILPGNVFGHNEAPMAVQFDAIAFDHLLRSHHGTSMIALRVPGASETQTVLIRHVEHEPRSGKIIHVDFFRVSLHERITVKVALRFVGESLGAKNEGGVVLHLLDALEVEGEAGSLPDAIEVDISPLEHIDDIIHAGTISLPSGFTLVTDAGEPVVKVAATRAEVAEEAEEAAEAEAAETAPAAPTEAASTEE